MSRLVFSVVGLQQESGLSLGIHLKEPATFGRRSVPLGVSLDAPEFQALRGVPPANAVRDAGRLLFDAVMTNQDLAPHMSSALLVQSPQRCPIFVELTTTGAESFPWEALCSADGDFLGLDERWAVGRIVETISPLPGNWLFEPPLRVAAILSCLGVPAADEWASLRAACESSDLPLRLLVLVSEEALHQEITEAGLDWVSEMSVRLQQFNAHVLHLFCHGLSTETSPHLQIAVRSDWLTGEKSSLMVEARDIRTFNPAVESLPWLVLLNSCETASTTASESARSVALDLIYEGGVPAVVGMREPVRSDDATLFTRAFYDQLLPEFAAMLVPGHTGGPLEWARLVVNARHQLADQYEPLSSQLGTKKEWTLPVVYTRPTTFEVQPRLPASSQADGANAAPDGAVGQPGGEPAPPDAATTPPAEELTPGDATTPAGEGLTPGDAVALPRREATPPEGTSPEPQSPDPQPPEQAPEQPAGDTAPDAAPDTAPDAETTRSIVLSIEALTGLRAQVEGSGDHQMLADIDRELRTLIDRLEAR